MFSSLASKYFGVFEDNAGEIDVAENLLPSFNSKRIDVRYHNLKDEFLSGDIDMWYLESEDRHTGTLTKVMKK